MGKKRILVLSDESHEAYVKVGLQERGYEIDERGFSQFASDQLPVRDYEAVLIGSLPDIPQCMNALGTAITRLRGEIPNAAIFYHSVYPSNSEEGDSVRRRIGERINGLFSGEWRDDRIADEIDRRLKQAR